MIHQSVTSSIASTERALRPRLGVHFMIDGDGAIYQFNDLADQVAHGNELNARSIGVEVVNPYVRKTKHWQVMIEPSSTAWKGRETADTPQQLSTLDQLLGVLCSHCFDLDGGTMEIPLEMPTQSATGPSKGSDKWFDKSVGGIIAHGHRPGRYPAGHSKAGERVKGTHADARQTVWQLYKMKESIQ